MIAIEIRLTGDRRQPIVDHARFSGGGPNIGLEAGEFVLFLWKMSIIVEPDARIELGAKLAPAVVRGRFPRRLLFVSGSP